MAEGEQAEAAIWPVSYLFHSWPSRPWYERAAGRYRLAEDTYLKIKRLLDVLLCVVGLPVVLLILAFCAVAIKLDSPGPVLFVQPRTGKGGRRFRMYKLRTMVQNAHQVKAKYLDSNQLSYPDDFKIRNDPRITWVGRLLRRTSLDELPQVFNVLRGEMSLVGPRPTVSASTDSLWQTARLDVEPGITGLWQVSGRSELSFDARWRLDIGYTRNRCLSLDLEILFRTIAPVIRGCGAS